MNIHASQWPVLCMKKRRYARHVQFRHTPFEQSEFDQPLCDHVDRGEVRVVPMISGLHLLDAASLASRTTSYTARCSARNAR